MGSPVGYLAIVGDGDDEGIRDRLTGGREDASVYDWISIGRGDGRRALEGQEPDADPGGQSGARE